MMGCHIVFSHGSFWWIISGDLYKLGAVKLFFLTDSSKAIHLLWIFYVFLSCVCYAFVRACLYVPCSQLLGKG